MFCFNRLKYRVQTAFQRHLCFNYIILNSVCISKALHFISLRIVIHKFVLTNYILNLILPEFFLNLILLGMAHLQFTKIIGDFSQE